MHAIRKSFIVLAGAMVGGAALAAPPNSQAIVKEGQTLSLQTVPTPQPAAARY